MRCHLTPFRARLFLVSYAVAENAGAVAGTVIINIVIVIILFIDEGVRLEDFLGDYLGVILEVLASQEIAVVFQSRVALRMEDVRLLRWGVLIFSALF